ncbi:MAG: pantoate--beta-alanine ligase, partial [Pseudomonadota bacterium]
EFLKSGTKLSRGFVPTMGALHQGHVSLIKRSLRDCLETVVSIFVNPKQFNSAEDLNNYPSTIEKDLELLEKQNVDVCFLPTKESMYPLGDNIEVAELNGVSKKFCGLDRPGHFEGVLTVVLKLLNLVQPQVLYMGEKDQQQLQLVRTMIESLFLDVDLVEIDTVRESSGLALSSRNIRLSDEDRLRASELFISLSSTASDEEVRENLEHKGFVVDYIETYNDRRFGAIRIGDVRLIDNVKV